MIPCLYRWRRSGLNLDLVKVGEIPFAPRKVATVGISDIEFRVENQKWDDQLGILELEVEALWGEDQTDDELAQRLVYSGWMRHTDWISSILAKKN